MGLWGENTWGFHMGLWGGNTWGFHMGLWGGNTWARGRVELERREGEQVRGGDPP